MGKKIRFPLKMNGVDVRTIEELREHFDLESVLGYFVNGKLVTWLRDRYYNKEAMAIDALSADDERFARKLCDILKVSYSDSVDDIDMEYIKRRQEKIALLSQITSDERLLSKIDNVAFNQEDLVNLLHKNMKYIYLCNEEFEVPISYENITYVGIGHVKIKLKTKYKVRLSKLNIRFVNVDVDYSMIEEDAKSQFEIGLKYEKGDGIEQDYAKALEYYSRAADKNYAEAMYRLGRFYRYGLGVAINYQKAIDLFINAKDDGSSEAMYELGLCYESGYGVEQDYHKAINLYIEAAEKDNVNAMVHLAQCYRDVDCGVRFFNDWYCGGYGRKALKWFIKAAENGNVHAMYSAAQLLHFGWHGVGKDQKEALKLCKLALEHGYESAESLLRTIEESL